MNLNKLSFIMEKVWLAIAIITALIAVYKLSTGAELSTFEYIATFIAFLLHISRKMIRKRLEKNQNEKGA